MAKHLKMVPLLLLLLTLSSATDACRSSHRRSLTVEKVDFRGSEQSLRVKVYADGKYLGSGRVGSSLGGYSKTLTKGTSEIKLVVSEKVDGCKTRTLTPGNHKCKVGSYTVHYKIVCHFPALKRRRARRRPTIEECEKHAEKVRKRVMYKAKQPGRYKATMHGSSKLMSTRCMKLRWARSRGRRRRRLWELRERARKREEEAKKRGQ
ncbi:hypothetical protein WMY93_020419 [Mugilogobius chulae]|uniref:Uncharacterized protein n=1 Tax=Mugilogobius chulae TaxID=88201 RepID=A0AAW0NH90_9GOBI